MINDNVIEKHIPFHTSVHVSKLNLTDEQRTAIINRVYDMEKTLNSEIISNVGGWQSPSLSDPTGLPEEPAIQQIFYLLGKVISDYKFTENLRPYLNNYWFNVNRNGDYNRAHNHPRSNFSATFYLKVPDGDCGNIQFLRTDKQEFALPRSDADGTYGSYYINAMEDIVIIFPSHLDHCVEANNTQEDRISCALNFELKP